MSEQTCQKCGCGDIGMRYHKKGCDKPGCSCSVCSYNDHSKVHKEHLHYYCRVCGWDWTGPVAAKASAAA